MAKNLLKTIALSTAVTLTALNLTGCVKKQVPVFFHEGIIDGELYDFNNDGKIDLLETSEEDGATTVKYIESNKDGTYTTYISIRDKFGHVTISDFTPLKQEGSLEIREITTNK
jgi:hypothetical protein